LGNLERIDTAVIPDGGDFYFNSSMTPDYEGRRSWCIVCEVSESSFWLDIRGSETAFANWSSILSTRHFDLQYMPHSTTPIL
jgi:hypothetical protein